MIDWLSFKIPLAEAHPEIMGGRHVVIDPSGNVEKDFPLPMPVEGSHDSNLHVSSTWHPARDFAGVTQASSYLYVTGNPIKWWQGHNLWGTDNLRELLAVTAERVCYLCGIHDVPAEIRALWWGGWVPLTRVDCTEMYQFGSRADVRAYLHRLEAGARSRHGRAITSGSTVYFGFRSRRWTLKFYSKGDELDSKSVKHQLPAGMMHRDRSMEWADGALRVELQLRRLELERRELGLSRMWAPGTALRLLEEHMEAIQTQGSIELPSDVLAALPGRLVSAYGAWQAGHDLRAYYPKATFYRLRRELLDRAGIDISIPVPSDRADNVVAFRRVVEFRRMGVPEWARSAGLYYEPPSFPLCEQASLF